MPLCYCDLCGIKCTCIIQFSEHLNGRKHTNKAARWAKLAPNGVTCRTCGVHCASAFALLQHYLGRKHTKNTYRGLEYAVPTSSADARTSAPQFSTQTPAPHLGASASVSRNAQPDSLPHKCPLCLKPLATLSGLQQHVGTPTCLSQASSAPAHWATLSGPSLPHVQLSDLDDPLAMQPGIPLRTTLVVQNTSPTDHVRLESGTLVLQGAGMGTVLTADFGTGPVQIAPGSAHQVPILSSMPAVGAGTALLTLSLSSTASGTVTSMARVLKLRCGSGAFESLRPSEPYKPPPRHRARPRRFVPGIPYKRGGRLVKNPPPLEIPGDLRRMVETNDEKGIKERIGSERLPRTVSGAVRRFRTLIHLEFLQHEIDIQQYSMAAASLIATPGGFLALEVPGLAESRPSVLLGDKLYAKRAPYNDHDVEFEGVVHAVESTRVLLKFDPSFHKAHLQGARYSIRFVVPESQFRFLGQALDQALLRPTPPVMLPIAPSLVDTIPRIPPMGPEVRWGAADAGMNDEQRSAVNAIALGAGLRLPFLIFGPPGTGKTTTMVSAIVRVLQSDPSARVLICAPSNEATNLVLERVLRRYSPASHVRRYYAYSVSPSSIPESLREVSAIGAPTASEVQSFRVVATTLLMSIKLFSNGLEPGHFTHIFVDEAGHAEEPLCLAPLLVHSSAGQTATQVILAGDPEQLGPVLLSNVAKEAGYGCSLLERLMHGEGASVNPYGRQPHLPGHYDPRLVVKLVRNYRSHPLILKVPSDLFYDGELVPCADPVLTHSFIGWEELPNPKVPLLFHSVKGADVREGNSPSWFNVEEIEVVHGLVRDLLGRRRNPARPEDIGIVTPYHRQATKMRKMLETKFGAAVAERVMVGSVERFQGSERKVIIISTVRSNADLVEGFDAKYKLGFLAHPKRFNVAVTRAQALLIVVGNAELLGMDPSWGALIAHCKEHGCFRGYEGAAARGGEGSEGGSRFGEKLKAMLHTLSGGGGRRAAGGADAQVGEVQAGGQAEQRRLQALQDLELAQLVQGLAGVSMASVSEGVTAPRRE